jgi:hypothetical protein
VKDKTFNEAIGGLVDWVIVSAAGLINKERRDEILRVGLDNVVSLLRAHCIEREEFESTHILL